MKLNWTQSAILMVVCVAALNGVYLWDMLTGAQEGMINIGMLAWVGIVIANLAIIACLVKLAGRE